MADETRRGDWVPPIAAKEKSPPPESPVAPPSLDPPAPARVDIQALKAALPQTGLLITDDEKLKRVVIQKTKGHAYAIPNDAAECKEFCEAILSTL